MPSNPVGIPSRGTAIAFSTLPLGEPPAYTPMTQLSKFDRSGAKTEFDDITCLDSPGFNKFPSPVVFDNGDYQGEGVYNPTDPTIIFMQQAAQSGQQLAYQITLRDGSVANGLCYVKEAPVFKVDVYKNLRFSFTISIFGVETLTPVGGAPIQE